jgi:methyl-accepting chemotaxis protein
MMVQRADSIHLDYTAMGSLDRLRYHGVRAWAVIGWGSFILLLIGDAVLDAGAGPLLLIVLGSVNIGPTMMALRGRYDAEARALMGSLAAIIPATMIFLLRGHPWQMDAHMYFFVGMAALVMLADWRPIILSTILIALHHLALEWLAPTWVFTGTGNFGRVVFHVLAAGLQCGVLTILAIQLERLFLSQQSALRRAEELADLAKQRQRGMEQAMSQAQSADAAAATERQARDHHAARLARDRRGELITLANEFEVSVTSVVATIGKATEHLELSASQLELISTGASLQAVEVASGASAAAVDISQVAATIQALSHSVQTIAVAANQQSALTVAASSEAKRSVQTATLLEGHAIQIETFLDDIRALASKTSLLALNATIEAARAGDAGRGFAVVAGEVKALSADTTRASDRISALISGIRIGIADTGEKLQNVDGAIIEVSNAAGEIASAVDRQRLTAQTVDDGADRVVHAAADIGGQISGVARATKEASILSAAVCTSSRDLAVTARTLRTSTDLFVSYLRSDDVRAA